MLVIGDALFVTWRQSYSLSLPRIQFHLPKVTPLTNSATVTLTPGDATQLSKWSHRHYQAAYAPECELAPSCTGGTITGQKHFLAALLTRR